MLDQVHILDWSVSDLANAVNLAGAMSARSAQIYILRLKKETDPLTCLVLTCTLGNMIVEVWKSCLQPVRSSQRNHRRPGRWPKSGRLGFGKSQDLCPGCVCSDNSVIGLVLIFYFYYIFLYPAVELPSSMPVFKFGGQGYLRAAQCIAMSMTLSSAHCNALHGHPTEPRHVVTIGQGHNSQLLVSSHP
jgi:hypothetical protein